MADVSLPIAFAAGILSFLTPCVFPLVPPYLVYLSGATIEKLQNEDEGGVRQRALLMALCFVAGFAMVFITIFGAGASYLGSFFTAYKDKLALIGGGLIIIMGLHFLGLFRLAFLMREARFQAGEGGSALGAFVMGLSFGFGWTPCIGPVLGAIATRVAQEGSIGYGVTLLGSYSAGLGVPFLVAAMFMKPFMGFMSRFRRHLGVVEKVMGGLLVLTGILFVTGAVTDFQNWMLYTFPWLIELEGALL
jgi:cytochrome c-type biogenesis protein